MTLRPTCRILIKGLPVIVLLTRAVKKTYQFTKKEKEKKGIFDFVFGQSEFWQLVLKQY